MGFGDGLANDGKGVQALVVETLVEDNVRVCLYDILVWSESRVVREALKHILQKREPPVVAFAIATEIWILGGGRSV